MCLVLLLLPLLLFLSSPVTSDPEAWSSSLPRGQQITNAQQGGGLLPFPEGRGPDGTLYKTDYRCEGENMTVSCLDSDGPGLHGTIQVVRGNFGRFSIAICNRHGQTDWSVNCMAPQTTRVLQQQCDGSKHCVVPVNSELFHDACPGTHKYLEIHYACLTSASPMGAHQGGQNGRKAPALPPWMFELQEASPTNSKVNTAVVNNNISANNKETADQSLAESAAAISASASASAEDEASASKNVRKPILVTEKVELERRVPITTPRPTTPSTTTRASTTTSTTRASTTTSRVPLNKSQKVLVSSAKSTLAAAGPASSDLDQDKPLNTPMDVYVTPMTGAPACQPVTARQLQWNWTPAGQVALQPCPIGATGLARWYCQDSPDQPTWQGDAPDMSDCKSVAMTNLESQVRQEDPENVLVSSLAYLTRTKSLYGGDLEAAVAIMRTVASRIQYRLQSSSSFHDKVNHIRQVLLNVLRSAANILEAGPNREAWLDLSADRQMKAATSLMLALEENAFLLAGVTKTPEEILETYETLTMTIKVLRVGHQAEAEVTFPAKPLLYVDDKISLAASDLEDNSQGGLGEAVFFSYRGLHEILSGAKTHLSFEDEDSPVDAGKSWRLNSRIISASLGRGRHIELHRPVTIELRHINTEAGVLQEPVCVFWDYEVHGWSDSGCQLIETNQTFSVCQCDHLTNFALLMRPITASPLLTNVRLDIVAYAVTSVVLLALLIILFKMRSRVKSWCQGCHCCCSVSMSDKERRTMGHLEKCQSFYTGLSQGPPSGPNGPGALMSGSAKKARTLGGPHGILTSGLTGANFAANTTSRVPGTSQYIDQGGFRTLSSTPLMMMTKPRPHITLNPYSTQLVDNLNMMMPSSSSNNNSTNSNSSASTNSTSLGTPLTQSQLMSPQLMNLTNTLRRPNHPAAQHNNEVVYRAVSPHGHVYWEIDPAQVYGTHGINNNEENVALLAQQQQHHHHAQQQPVSRPYLTSRHGQLTEEDLLLQQHLLASDPAVTNGLHDSINGLQHVETFQPGMVMMASSSSSSNGNNNAGSFVRTGANRFTRKQQSSQQAQQAQPQQQTVATVSTSQASNVPEQLQTQVQIRDIRPIQVSVKSSEYIEAKIRTLRRGGNNNHSDS